MPKIAKELGALAIKNLKHTGKNKNPERVAVGGVSGLMLQVTLNNAKSWLLRTTIAGKRRFIGLGPYPEISLKEAKEKAKNDKENIREGRDPVAERKNARDVAIEKKKLERTFADILPEFLKKELPSKSLKRQKQWENSLKTYALPVIGDVLCDEITANHIFNIVEPIWKSKTETASAIRGRLESALNFSMVSGYCKPKNNPARWEGNLKERLTSPKILIRQKSTHHPAIQYKQAPMWYMALQERNSISAKALEFLALTACRSGEVRGAVWSEIDLDQKLWVIPKGRTKLSREHRVPLSDRAVEILANLPKFEGNFYVFPSTVKKTGLSNMAFSKIMRGMHDTKLRIDSVGWIDAHSQKRAVPHGLRSTFRQWAGEKTNYPREIVELCLAHDIMGSVERAYMRSDVLEKRRKIMDEWTDFLLGSGL